MVGVDGILPLQTLTIYPCQLHESMSDKDASFTSNNLVDGLYQPCESDLDLE